MLFITSHATSAQNGWENVLMMVKVTIISLWKTLNLPFCSENYRNPSFSGSRLTGHVVASRVLFWSRSGEYSGNLSDVLNSQSQPAAEDSLANELCGRAWTFSGMESVCIEGSQVKTGCFMTFKMCWSVKHASRMTLARKYGGGIRFVFQEKSEKGKLSRVFQLSGTF